MRTKARAWLVGSIVCVLALASTVRSDTEICGDLDGSGSLVASDALLLLRKAVGQDLVIECPAVCPISTTTTTTSTTSTTMPARVCGNLVVEPGEDCDGSDTPCAGGTCQPNCRCSNFSACGNGSLDGGETCDGSDDACVGGTCDLTLCTCSNECESSLDCSGQPCVGSVCATPCSSNTGCTEGESCSGIVSASAGEVSVCIDENPDGLPLLSPCNDHEECLSRLCISGECTVACEQDEDCPGEVCSPYSEFVKLCRSVCDALAQDCTQQNDACFPILAAETTQCAPSASPGTQGDDCQFANSCEKGYGCTLLNEAQTGLVCAFLCDALGGGGPTCADGPGAVFTCVAINDYYSNVDGFPPDLGMCVPPPM